MTTAIDIPKLLTRLTRLRSEEHRIVTCYLKLEPRDRVRGKYRIKLKNRLRQVESLLRGGGLDLARGVREEVLGDLTRVYDYLSDSHHLPDTQGVAIFASSPLRLFEVVPLPGVHRSRLAVDRTALVRELAALEEEVGTLLAAVLDRTSARFFEVTAFGARELEGLRSASTRGGKYHADRQSSPGLGEFGYHNRIREEKNRHFAAVADRLFQLHRQRSVDGVVLAGPGREAAAVAGFLHPYLAERLMGVVSLNPKTATPGPVREAVLATRAQYERATERGVARGLEEALGVGWGVNGMPETLRALGRGQVRTLVVDADAQQPGFRAVATGRLALNQRELAPDGEVLPVLDVVDEAIEEALRQRVEVQVLYDVEARRGIEGLAGLLRFR